MTPDLDKVRMAFADIQDGLKLMGVAPPGKNVALNDQLIAVIRADLLGVGLDSADEVVLAGALGGLLIMTKMVMPLTQVVPHFSLSIINQSCAMSTLIVGMIESLSEAFDVLPFDNDGSTDASLSDELPDVVPDQSPTKWWKRPR